MNNNFNYNNKITNINFKGIPMKGKADMQTFENIIEQALVNISERIQREMPANGDFAKIVEKFKNPQNNTFADDFSIEVVAGSGKELRDKRFVKVVTEHPYMDKAINSSIYIGTTDEVRAFFKDAKKYVNMVKDVILRHSEKLS